MKHLLLSNIHDSNLCAVDVRNFPKTVKLVFFSEQHKNRDIILFNCLDYRLVDLKRQNIVSRIILQRGSGVDVDSVRQQIVWIYSYSDSSSILANVTT